MTDDAKRALDTERMVSLVGRLRQFAERQAEAVRKAQKIYNELIYLMHGSEQEISAAALLGNEAMTLWQHMTRVAEPDKKQKKKPKKKPSKKKSKRGKK